MRTGKRDDRDKNRSRALAGALRYGFWVLVVVLALGALLLGWQGLQRLFFGSNPRFTLRHIEIHGAANKIIEEDVRGCLMRAGVWESKNDDNTPNLYRLDLAELRRRLEALPMVQRVELRRILPDRLDVTVDSRKPVAQVLKVGGWLIDKHGVLLPALDRQEYLELPVLTGIAGIGSFQANEQLDQPLVRAALDLLAYKGTLPNGAWLQPRLVQLNPRDDELILTLAERKEAGLRDGAILVLPAKDHERAARRILDILKTRADAGQTTGSINATFEKIAAEP